MNAGLVILLVVVVILVVAAALFLVQRRRSEGLRDRFGPEYERTMARSGDRRAAESELSAREQRRREFTIVPLEPADQARYQQEWRATQARFVDDPAGATRDADLLVARVMRERGYPVEDDFERQAADVSVDHPQVAENYRAAHAVHRANEQGLASTDDLRQAFVHYRSLFSELLDVDGDDRKEAHQ
jgi:predicted nucleic acid-binding protein